MPVFLLTEILHLSFKSQFLFTSTQIFVSLLKFYIAICSHLCSICGNIRKTANTFEVFTARLKPLTMKSNESFVKISQAPIERYVCNVFRFKISAVASSIAQIIYNGIESYYMYPFIIL